ncbi:MAG TPA: hypothetical protein VF810_01160 [Patescibacteria group bacterium]
MRLFLILFRAFLTEQYYMLTYPVASLFVRNIPKPSNYKATIIFVECWFQKNPYHRKWSAYLEEKGYRIILLHFANMYESYEQTAQKLNNTLQSMDLKNYTLVGISSGAVLCLYYLDHFNHWGDIKTFISVGGPFRGTYLAWTIAFTKKGRSLLPGSKFLEELSKQDFPKNKMVTFSAEIDELVPRSSSTIPGVKSYILPANGHNVFHLSYQKTYDLIAELAIS